MAELYHAVVKDHDNSGYAWEAFFCKDCLDAQVNNRVHLEVLRRNLATPKYLSCLYPPLLDEPCCCECGEGFTY